MPPRALPFKGTPFEAPQLCKNSLLICFSRSHRLGKSRFTCEPEASWTAVHVDTRLHEHPRERCGRSPPSHREGSSRGRVSAPGRTPGYAGDVWGGRGCDWDGARAGGGEDVGKEGDGLRLLHPERCCSGGSYLVGFPACYVGGEFYNCQEQKPTQRAPGPKVNIFFPY